MRTTVAMFCLLFAHASRASPIAETSKLIRGPRPVRERYMVVLQPDLSRSHGLADQANHLAARHGGRVVDVWESVVYGFAAEMPEAAAIAMANDPLVRWVEEDQYVSLDGTQSNPPNGLDRVDQRSLPLDLSYTYPVSASGVNVYVIDTGIQATHPEFGGRVVLAYSAVSDGIGADNPPECNGHGTHVAGIIGGSTYGIAKKAKLHSVRVLDCSGSGYQSWIVSALNWLRANHRDPAIANMSLHYGPSTTVDTAVQQSIDAGISFVVAAGNQHADACEDSPARVGAAITVAASEPASDAVAYFSNYGTCVDLYAPGVAIISTWNGSAYYGCPYGAATCALEGTSMASPHVAGTAAMYLAGQSGALPSQVANAIVANATTNAMTGVPAGTPNRLLYSPFMPGCSDALAMCAGVCVDLAVNTNNCGECYKNCTGSGIKCFDGEGGWYYAGVKCSGGRCVSRSCDEL